MASMHPPRSDTFPYEYDEKLGQLVFVDGLERNYHCDCDRYPVRSVGSSKTHLIMGDVNISPIARPLHLTFASEDDILTAAKIVYGYWDEIKVDHVVGAANVLIEIGLLTDARFERIKKSFCPSILRNVCKYPGGEIVFASVNLSLGSADTVIQAELYRINHAYNVGVRDVRGGEIQFMCSVPIPHVWHHNVAYSFLSNLVPVAVTTCKSFRDIVLTASEMKVVDFVYINNVPKEKRNEFAEYSRSRFTGTPSVPTDDVKNTARNCGLNWGDPKATPAGNPRIESLGVSPTENPEPKIPVGTPKKDTSGSPIPAEPDGIVQIEVLSKPSAAFCEKAKALLDSEHYARLPVQDVQRKILNGDISPLCVLFLGVYFPKTFDEGYYGKYPKFVLEVYRRLVSNEGPIDNKVATWFAHYMGLHRTIETPGVAPITKMPEKTPGEVKEVYRAWNEEYFPECDPESHHMLFAIVMMHMGIHAPDVVIANTTPSLHVTARRVVRDVLPTFTSAP